MAVSHSGQVTKIIQMLLLLDPKSVLDLGTGHGLYGFLVRQYLNPDHLLDDPKNKIVLDGVEGYKKYISVLHNFVYDHIYNEDILKIDKYLKRKYDLIMLIDVIEHFELEEGIDLLKSLLPTNGVILISTPKFVGKQSANDNLLEEHKSQWTLPMFKKLGFTLVYRDRVSHLLLISKDKVLIDLLSKKKQKLDLKEFFGSNPILNKLYRRYYWTKKFGI